MQGPAIFIITGEQGEGKSSFTGRLAETLKNHGCTVAGIIAEGLLKGTLRTGFLLTDAATGIKIPLAERISHTGPRKIKNPSIKDKQEKQAGSDDYTLSPGSEKKEGNQGRPETETGGEQVKAGNFIFFRPALLEGKKIIENAILYRPDIIILDEIGSLELEGRIWAGTLESLLERWRGILILTVRQKFLKSVISHWKLNPAGIFNIACINTGGAAEKILRFLKPGFPDNSPSSG
jgi:nucleoside-triphosphatase THEP1